MDIFNKETIDGNKEIINSLTREHCKYMEEKGTFKRSDIMKMDMIDLRGAVEYSRSGLGTVDKNAALPANMHTLITDDFVLTVGRYTFDQTGTYDIKYEVTDAIGSHDEVTVKLMVTE